MDAVVCQRCFSALPASLDTEVRCTGCGAHARLTLFPALLKPSERGQSGETLLVDGQSSCYYHPEKAASIPCETCGRFLCSLCDIELGDRHVCPGCLASDESDARSGLDAQRALPDTVALDLSIFPIVIPLFLWATIFTAPMVLFMCVQYWNAETSVVRRSRWRIVLALLIAGSQLVLIITFFFFILIGAFVS